MNLQVDAVADFICPWCYLGKSRLEKALSHIQGEERPKVLWHPFQLNPDMPVNGMSVDEYLDKRFGGRELVQPFLDELTVAGEKEGIIFRFDHLERIPNTLNAHRQIIKIEIDNVERSAVVFSPSNPGASKLPLVFVFHGRGDDSGKFARAVKLHKDWKNAVVVYPRGLTIDTRPPMRGWQGRTGQYDDRDLKFTDLLLQRITTMFPVDPQKTYVAGFSNGGHFTFLLLKERPDRFVAYAVIGALQPDFQSDAAPKPFILLFGREEGPQFQEQWVNTVKAMARHSQASGEESDYEDCCTLLYPKPGGAAMVYGLYNAGHIWPYRGNESLMRFFTQATLDIQTAGSGKK